jgi:aryl-alcohol dehydrogenase-like predicted oxidoreductase
MDGKLTANRKIGAIDISPIALGTMRFADKQTTKEEIADLLSFLYHETGINVHHSSVEYASYPLYCEALKDFKKKAKQA